MPQRGGDLVGRGEDEGVDAAETGVQLPDAEQREDDGRGEHGPSPSPRAGRPARAPGSRRRRDRSARGGGGAREVDAPARPPPVPAGPRAPPPGRPGGSPPRTSWVTSRTVRGSAASASASHSCMAERVIESSAPKGSSRRRAGRPASSVRKKATRWRMPPESAAGRDCSNSCRPKRAKSGSARRRASGPSPRRHSSARAAFPSASRQGRSRSRCGMYAEASRRGAPGSAPWISTAPSSGSWSPATISSRVDFPQPEGPTTATTSPGRMLREAVEGGHERASPKRRVTPLSEIPIPFNDRGSVTGASASTCIAPSAGITPQVRRVSAGRSECPEGAISARLSASPPGVQRHSSGQGAWRAAVPRPGRPARRGPSGSPTPRWPVRPGRAPGRRVASAASGRTRPGGDSV